jgi:chitin disaccharide deacetylase
LTSSRESFSSTKISPRAKQPERPAEVRRLIVTADDFGLSRQVNEAVEEAHRHGILSAASLMVGAPAAEDAIARAQNLGSLGVGLHLTLLDARPVLPHEAVPGLVGPDGRLPRDPLRFGIALFVSRDLRRQARAEIAAQFERFAQTGLVMDHINGHQHFHLHPVVVQAITELAPRYGLPPVRVPLEPFSPSFRASGDRPVGRMMAWLFYLWQTRRLRRALDAAGLRSNDQLFGHYDSGAVTETRLARLIEHLPPGVSEIYCHPATGRWEGSDNLPASYRCEEEFQALTSTAVKERLKALGLQPRSFRTALQESR